MLEARKKPRQQRAQATWDAILDSAVQLFDELGYAATTTNKIAERAGVSIGSLYQYFPNKDALLLALAEKHMAQASVLLMETLRKLDHDKPGLAQTLSQLIDVSVALHKHEPVMHRLLFDQTPRTPDMVRHFRQLEILLAHALTGQLIRLGVAGPQPQARALLLVQGLEAQIHGAVINPPPGVSNESIIDDVRTIWLAALTGLSAATPD